jgi:parallel beta-helix repeat protein
MNHGFATIIIIVLILLGFLNYLPVAVCVKEIIVREGESIQDAINTASPGSIIRIMPGKFHEQLEINKTLTIIGSGNETVILGSGTTTCVKIVRGVTEVKLSNLCIDGAGSYKATGLWIQQSNRNQLLNITIKNFYKGLRIYDSSQNILRNVRLLSNTYNFEVYGLYLSHFIHDIDSSNTVNGKKIYYLVNIHNVRLTGDAGYVAIVNSTNVNIANMTLSDNFSGILLAYTNSSVIRNVNCTRNVQGIRLVNSHNITITRSLLTFNEWSGISLEPATTCKIYSNKFKFNVHALYLSISPYILQVKTRFNQVFLNEFSNNSVGIYLDEVDLNEFYNNNFDWNNVAIKVDEASNNLVFHNNFLNNAKNVDFVATSFSNVTNVWDKGYPFGGNFWLNLNETDNYKGASQNTAGSDGIMDQPYSIGFNNIDRYPLFFPTIPILMDQLNEENPFEISGFFSDVFNFSFNPSAPYPYIEFKIVAHITCNFCRVGIPRNLLWAEEDKWVILLNGSEAIFEAYSSNNYTFLFFKIPSFMVNDISVIVVKVLGSGAISEYTSIGPLIIFFIAFLICFAAVKKHLNRPRAEMWAFIFISFLILTFSTLSIVICTCTYTYNYSTESTLVVGEGGFKTIKEALEHALDGDEIIVRAGVYREQVVVNKLLKLRGEGFGKTVIETDAFVDAVVIFANNVSVQGFAVRNYGGTAYSSGIRLINASDCKIENNLIEGKFIGIRLENGSCRNIIQNNIIRSNQYGMFFMRRSSGNTVFNNSILGSGWNGIELAWYSDNNVFEANTIANNGGYGIEVPIYSPSYENMFFHNNFLNNSLSNPLGGHASDFFNNSWCFNGEGNFWDNYNFTDCDKNGIGDTWYCINEEKAIYDKYPLMGKYRCFNLFDEETISAISSSEILFINATIFDGQASINICLYEDERCGLLRLGVPKKVLADLSYSSPNEIFFINLWSKSDYNYFYAEYSSGKILIQISGTTEIPELTRSTTLFTALSIVLFSCFALKLKLKKI